MPPKTKHIEELIQKSASQKQRVHKPNTRNTQNLVKQAAQPTSWVKNFMERQPPAPIPEPTDLASAVFPPSPPQKVKWWESIAAEEELKRYYDRLWRQQQFADLEKMRSKMQQTWPQAIGEAAKHAGVALGNIAIAAYPLKNSKLAGGPITPFKTTEWHVDNLWNKLKEAGTGLIQLGAESSVYMAGAPSSYRPERRYITFKGATVDVTPSSGAIIGILNSVGITPREIEQSRKELEAKLAANLSDPDVPKILAALRAYDNAVAGGVIGGIVPQVAAGAAAERAAVAGISKIPKIGGALVKAGKTGLKGIESAGAAGKIAGRVGIGMAEGLAWNVPFVFGGSLIGGYSLPEAYKQTKATLPIMAGIGGLIRGIGGFQGAKAELAQLKAGQRVYVKGKPATFNGLEIGMNEKNQPYVGFKYKEAGAKTPVVAPLDEVADSLSVTQSGKSAPPVVAATPEEAITLLDDVLLNNAPTLNNIAKAEDQYFLRVNTGDFVAVPARPVRFAVKRQPELGLAKNPQTGKWIVVEGATGMPLSELDPNIKSGAGFKTQKEALAHARQFIKNNPPEEVENLINKQLSLHSPDDPALAPRYQFKAAGEADTAVVPATPIERDPAKSQKHILDSLFPPDMPEEAREALRQFEVVSKSPYSDSFYNITNKGFNDNPEGAMRMSDHWNWTDGHGFVHEVTDVPVPPDSWALARRENNKWKILGVWPKDFENAPARKAEQEFGKLLALNYKAPRLSGLLKELLDGPKASSQLFDRTDATGRKYMQKLLDIGIAVQINPQLPIPAWVESIPGAVEYIKSHPKTQKLYAIKPEHMGKVGDLFGYRLAEATVGVRAAEEALDALDSLLAGPPEGGIRDAESFRRAIANTNKWTANDAELMSAITEAHRKAHGMEEQAYYQKLFADVVADMPGAPTTAKAMVEFQEDGRAILAALNNPDISSGVHELAHVFRQWLPDDVQAQILAAYKRTHWDVKLEEQFARGFEKYLRTGKAPIPELESVFAKLKELLTTIYKRLRGSPIDIKIPDPVKAAYDRMLGLGDEMVMREAPLRTESPLLQLTEHKVRIAEAQGKLTERSRAIIKAVDDLSYVSRKINKLIKANPPGSRFANAYNIDDMLQRHPELVAEIRKIEGQAGEALGYPVRVLDENNKLPKYSIELRMRNGKPEFPSLLRSLAQSFLDGLPADDFEALRTQIVSAMEEAYQSAGKYTNKLRRSGTLLLDIKDPETGTINQVPSSVLFGKLVGEVDQGKYLLSSVLKEAEKTVAALNIRNACPMLNVGGHSCYLDACYVFDVLGRGKGASTALYDKAMYLGEILQLSDSEVKLLNSTGGLRINGQGDTVASDLPMWRDIVKHAQMRGLKLKVITKQPAVFEIASALTKEGYNLEGLLLIEPTIDPYWIPHTMDVRSGSGVEALGIGMGQTPEALEESAQLYKNQFGREAKLINGVLHRKYGLSWEQLDELLNRMPELKKLVTPRVVTSTYKEIADIALQHPEAIQTWMHANLAPGMYSDIHKAYLTPNDIVNFQFDYSIFYENGEWHIRSQKKQRPLNSAEAQHKLVRWIRRLGGLLNLTPEQQAEYKEFKHSVMDAFEARAKRSFRPEDSDTIAKELENYIKTNYTAEEQNKIFAALAKNKCCAGAADKNICTTCLTHCADHIATFGKPDEVLEAVNEYVRQYGEINIQGRGKTRARLFQESFSENDNKIIEAVRVLLRSKFGKSVKDPSRAADEIYNELRGRYGPKIRPQLIAESIKREYGAKSAPMAWLSNVAGGEKPPSTSSDVVSAPPATSISPGTPSASARSSWSAPGEILEIAPPASGVATPAKKKAIVSKYAPEFGNGRINLDRYATPAEVKAGILQDIRTTPLTPKNKAELHTYTLEGIRKQAMNEVAMHEKEWTKLVDPSHKLTPEELYNLRSFFAQSRINLVKAWEAYKAMPTNANQLAYTEAYSHYAVMLNAIRGASHTASKLLNSLRLSADARRYVEAQVRKTLSHPRVTPSGRIVPPASSAKSSAVRAAGRSNTVWTANAFQDARARLLGKYGPQRLAQDLGLPAEDFQDIVTCGGYLAEAGISDPAAWRKAMSDELGTWVEPHLDAVWDTINKQYDSIAANIVESVLDDKLEKVAKIITNSWGGREEVPQEIMAAMASLPTMSDSEIAKFVRDSVKLSTWDAIHAYFYGNMLSAPGTHMVNVMSNALFAGGLLALHPARVATDIGLVAVQNALMKLPRIGKAIPKRERNYYMRQWLPMANGIISGFPVGLQRAARILEEGFELDVALKAGESGITAELPFLQQIIRPRLFGKQVLPAMQLNPWNTIRRAMAAADVIFEEMAREAHLMEQASRKAIKELEDGSAKSFGELVSEMREFGLTENDYIKADEVARYVTFKQRPGPFLSNFIRAINMPIPSDTRLVGGLRPLRLFVPFVQIGANIAKIGVEFSPLGLAGAMRKGAWVSPEMAEALTKSAIGTVVMGTVYTLADSGVIELTGAPPTDPARSAQWYEFNQPYSIRVKNGPWIPYHRFGPVACPLAAAAALLEHARNSGVDIINRNMIMEAAASIGQFTLDQSFYQGLNSLIELVRNPENYTPHVIGGVLSQAIPLSSALRAGVRATDPRVFDIESTWHKLMTNLPKLSQLVPSKVDPFGREIKLLKGGGIVALWPFTAGKPSKDFALRELVRLNIPVGPAGRKIATDEGIVVLSKEAWRTYQKAIGRPQWEALHRVVSYPEYQDITDAERYQLIVDALHEARRSAQREYHGRLSPLRFKHVPRISRLGF